LVQLAGDKWQATFVDIEKLLGFALPDSARVHRPWWANQGERGGHSHALAWEMAGWKTSHVNMAEEWLVFVRATPIAHEDASDPDERLVFVGATLMPDEDDSLFPNPDDNQGKDLGITDEEWKAGVKQIGAFSAPLTRNQLIKSVINYIRSQR